MSKIDDAADTVKGMTDKAASSAKQVVRQTGEKIKRVGEAIKKEGK